MGFVDPPWSRWAVDPPWSGWPTLIKVDHPDQGGPPWSGSSVLSVLSVSSVSSVSSVWSVWSVLVCFGLFRSVLVCFGLCRLCMSGMWQEHPLACRECAFAPHVAFLDACVIILNIFCDFLWFWTVFVIFCQTWDTAVIDNYVWILFGWILEDWATWRGFQLILCGNLCSKQGKIDWFLSVKNDCFFADLCLLRALLARRWLLRYPKRAKTSVLVF